MEFDPLARDVAPPRHEIESDSEDEIEVGDPKYPRSVFTPPVVQLSLPKDRDVGGGELIILLSEGGEAFLRAQRQQWGEAGKLMIDDEQHGSLAIADDSKTILMLLRPSIKLLGDQAIFPYICLPILSSLKPSKLTIVDDYNSALYISVKELTDPPVRYISTGKETLKSSIAHGIELFEAPNYVLGLSAAMMNESSLLAVPSTLLLLPRIINSHLQSWSRIQANSSSLDTQPDPLEADLATCLSSQSPLSTCKFSTSTTLSPSILDFLQSRRSQARRKMAENISAMYV